MSDVFNPWNQSDADAAFKQLKTLDPGVCWQEGKYNVRGTSEEFFGPYLCPIKSVSASSDFYHASNRAKASHRYARAVADHPLLQELSRYGQRRYGRMLAYIPGQFNPAIARCVFHELGGGRVLDPCAGWGDRLAAAMSLSTVHSYTGIDPNSALASGYTHQISRYGDEKRHSVIHGCAEDMLSTLDREYDIVFSCPPYFDTEIYSREITQSCIKFPTFSKWVSGFLSPLIEHSFRLLRPGGYLALCLADSKRNKNMIPLCSTATSLVSDLLGYELVYCWGVFLFNQQSTLPLCERLFVWRK